MRFENGHQYDLAETLLLDLPVRLGLDHDSHRRVTDSSVLLYATVRRNRLRFRYIFASTSSLLLDPWLALVSISWVLSVTSGLSIKLDMSIRSNCRSCNRQIRQVDMHVVCLQVSSLLRVIYYWLVMKIWRRDFMTSWQFAHVSLDFLTIKTRYGFLSWSPHAERSLWRLRHRKWTSSKNISSPKVPRNLVKWPSASLRCWNSTDRCLHITVIVCKCALLHSVIICDHFIHRITISAFTDCVFYLWKDWALVQLSDVSLSNDSVI